MSSKNLSRRLERLEARLIPAGDPMAIQVRYVSPDRSVVDGPRIVVVTARGSRPLTAAEAALGIANEMVRHRSPWQ